MAPAGGQRGHLTPEVEWPWQGAKKSFDPRGEMALAGGKEVI